MTLLANERVHSLDALRGTTLLLAIVLHMTMSFLLGATYFWIVTDSQSSTSLAMGFYGNCCKFFFAALSLRAAALRLDRLGRLGAIADRLMRSTFGPGGIVFWAAPLAVVLAVQPGQFAWFGIPTPDQTLYLNVPAAAGFGLAFAFGWLLARQPALLAKLRAHWLWLLLLALALGALFLWVEGPTLTLAPMAMGGKQWLVASADAIAGWSATLARMSLALFFASGYSAARRYLADASYWLYLIHLPLVRAVQVALSRLDWPWPIKFPLMLLLGVVPMQVSYQVCVRYTFIGNWLNDRRKLRATSGRTSHAS